MNEELKKAIEASTVLSNEQKQKILQALEGKILSIEKKEEFLARLKRAEVDRQKCDATRDANLKQASNEYVATLKHLPTKAMHQVEEKDRAEEAAELLEMAKQLDNLQSS